MSGNSEVEMFAREARNQMEGNGGTDEQCVLTFHVAFSVAAHNPGMSWEESMDEVRRILNAVKVEPPAPDPEWMVQHEPGHVHPSFMECNVMCPGHPNTVKRPA